MNQVVTPNSGRVGDADQALVNQAATHLGPTGFDPSRVAALAKRLPKGAARACLAMTDQWQFCGKSTFDANGAWSLDRQGRRGRDALAESEAQKDGKWSRTAYRLTPLGLALRAHLAAQGMETRRAETP